MTTIKVRGGTAAQWASANPVLAAREPGVETDTGVYKVGDGSTAWASLNPVLNSTYAQLSTVTALKTSAYTAVVGDIVLCDPSTRTVTDGVTTSGSKVITSATAAFTAADVSKTITGSGIPNGTVISTVDSATQVTTNANSTASASGVSVGIGGPFTVTLPASGASRDSVTVIKVDNGSNVVTLGGPLDTDTTAPRLLLHANRAQFTGRWDSTTTTWRAVAGSADNPPAIQQWKAVSRTTGTSFLTKLASGHPFTVSSQGSGSVNLNDTAFPGPYSDRSITITPAAGSGIDSSCYCQTGAISVDLTSKSLLVWVNWNDAASGTLEVKIGDAGLSNDYVWNIGRPGTWNGGYGGWTCHELLTTGPSGNTIGSPTIASLVKMRITTYKGSGGAVHIGGIATRTLPTSTYANGAVLFTFDDGGLAALSGQQKLAQYGFPGVAHVICGSVGTDPATYMTLNQLRALQAEGWEIAGHAMTVAGHDGGGGVGFTGLTTQQIRDEFAGQRAWLNRYGFTSTAWASPHGQCSPTVWDIGRNYFSLHRGAGGASVTQLPNEQSAPFTRPEQVDAMTFNSSSCTAANMDTAIDNVVLSKGVLALNFHGGTFATGASSGEQINTADFATIVDHANSAGVSVVTFAQIQRDFTAYAD